MLVENHEPCARTAARGNCAVAPDGDAQQQLREDVTTYQQSLEKSELSNSITLT